ncbi:ATP-binding protein [Eleftheria terrae]|uniref:ATP-binding protein n=1 Tax=Eleftheria terrae TaxID=1597781 RepID=UPI00263AE502|nr:ATP-binding protein [Eleftheria terrae]WKB51139.1 ATP-binding protein [Eleftheria terrae]
MSREAARARAGLATDPSAEHAAEARPAWHRGFAWRQLGELFGNTLQGRFTLVMVAGVLLAQLATNLLWAQQLRSRAQAEAEQAAHHVAIGAAGAIRSFRDLPVNFRPLLIEQLRTMGGTRFFVFVNREPVKVEPVQGEALAQLVAQTVAQTLKQQAPVDGSLKVALAWPHSLHVSPDGVELQDLPEGWIDTTLLSPARPAPIVVIQAEIESGSWLYLASAMPDPYFLENANPYAVDRLLPQVITLGAVLLLSVAVVRTLTRPLARLGRAATAFGNGISADPLPVAGTREVQRTIRAFNDMQERIQRYLMDRERLFATISHDLRTPITRLKLRTELLDDDSLQAEFHEDLDDLDMMVKGALQSVKDTDIHENQVEVRLDHMLERLVRDARMAGREVSLQAPALSVRVKPLALKRALTNLLDNALQYGERADIRVDSEAERVVLTIRDHGPGVPEAALDKLGQPYVRLEHGRRTRREGMGLGLGIARNVVHAHGGQLRLANHPEGGLMATVLLPLG